MNDLQIFQNPQFGQIRTFSESDGKVLFCGYDVAKALGYSNARDAVNRHCRDVVKRDAIDNLGRKQSALFIPEGDIYRLAARSTLPGAEEFERWIFDEILPTIRTTGTYITKQMSPAEILAAQAQLLVQMEQKVDSVENRTIAVEEKLDRAVKVFSRPTMDHWRDDMNQAVMELCKQHKLSPVATRGRMYNELERVAACSTASRLTRLRTRKRKGGATRKEINALSKIDAISADQRLRPIFEGIVRTWQADYCNK